MNKFKEFMLKNPEYDLVKPLDEAEWVELMANSNPLEKYLRQKRKELDETQSSEE